MAAFSRESGFSPIGCCCPAAATQPVVNAWMLKEDINSVTIQIISIKLTYGDSVMNFSGHSLHYSDIRSSTSLQNRNQHQTSPGVWSISPPQNNTTPITTALSAQYSISYSLTVSGITGAISPTIPPPPSAALHLHTVEYTAQTCTTDGIIHS